MTGPPSPKRQRTDDKPTEPSKEELEQIQKVLDSVAKVHEELEKVNEEQAKEILAVETKFNAKKRPTLEKRNKLLADIPHFWQHAFVNHPLIGNLIDEHDAKLLDYVEDFDVKFVDDNGGYKLEMSFKENPYVENKTLWKQFTYTEVEGEDEEESPLKVTASEISWKAEAKMSEDSETFNFFQWFTLTEPSDEIAEIFRDDLFKNPVMFYLMDEDEDEEGEGDEEEEQEEEAEDKE